MATEKQITRLKELINIALDDCDPYELPNVYSLSQKKNLRPYLEELFINSAKKSGISVFDEMQVIEKSFKSDSPDDLTLVNKLINLLLDDIDKNKLPYVYNAVNSTPISRTLIVEKIVTFVKSGISVSGGIWRIERIFDPNVIED